MANVRPMWQKLNISQACGLFTAMMVLLSGLVISLLTHQQQLQRGQQQAQQDTRLQLQRLALTLAPSLLNEDRVSLNLTLNEWQRGDHIETIRVLNTNQQVLAETTQPASKKTSANHKISSQTITQDNLVIGVLQATTNTNELQQGIRRQLSVNLLSTALMALLSALAAYQLSERGLRYLRQLPPKLHRWQDDGELQLDTPLLPELAELHNTLEHISAQQKQHRVLQQAMDKFINNNHSENHAHFCYQACAMLYIEIQELEVLQSRLSASDLSTLLNQYHKLLSQAAKLYNGKLDRFQGDGIVMLFGLPKTNAQDALHCLYAAQLFLGLIDHLREHDSQLLPLEFRIAAHYGQILLAPIGDGQQLQGNLIGDTLHWTSQLAQNGEERRLLVSQAIIDQVQQETDINWQSGPQISNLHGKNENSYWLQQLPEKNQLLIQRQIKHITAMTEQA